MLPNASTPGVTMPILRLATTAAALAVAVARSPAGQAALRMVVENPRLRSAAAEATREAAYRAGRIARIVVPRGLIR